MAEFLKWLSGKSRKNRNKRGSGGGSAAEAPEAAAAAAAAPSAAAAAAPALAGGGAAAADAAHARREEAPVVHERIHDKYEHVDKTQVEEIHEKTHVHTTIQPIKDTRVVEAAQLHVVDEGAQVRQIGQPGLDDSAQEELRRRHEALVRSGRTRSTATHVDVDEKADVKATEQMRQVEQVQPVIERDIAQLRRVEHRQAEITIIHKPIKYTEVVMAPPVTVNEYVTEDPSGALPQQPPAAAEQEGEEETVAAV